MKNITAEQLMGFKPCGDYPEARIREIAGDKEEWSALDILALENVPPSHRLWVVLREELIDAPVLHEFGCRCAERALARIKNPDPRSVNAVAVKRRWVRGEATDDELVAARAAARQAAQAALAAWAAWDAAGAARDAAWAAARDSARDAAWSALAAWDSARDSALDAAWAAAWTAEREDQVAMLREMLEEERQERRNA
jgi:hypothetical protein